MPACGSVCWRRRPLQERGSSPDTQIGRPLSDNGRGALPTAAQPSSSRLESISGMRPHLTACDVKMAGVGGLLGQYKYYACATNRAGQPVAEAQAIKSLRRQTMIT